MPQTALLSHRRSQRLHRSSWAHQHRAVQAGGTGGRGGAQLRRCVPPRWSEASGLCTQSCQCNNLELSTFVPIPSLSLPTRCIHLPPPLSATLPPAAKLPLLLPGCPAHSPARCCDPPHLMHQLDHLKPRFSQRDAHMWLEGGDSPMRRTRLTASKWKGRLRARAKGKCATPATSLSFPSPLYRAIFKMAALQASTQRPVCAASRPAAAIAPLKGASVAAQTSQGVTAVRIRGQNWLCPPSGGSAHLLTLTCMA